MISAFKLNIGKQLDFEILIFLIINDLIFMRC